MRAADRTSFAIGGVVVAVMIALEIGFRVFTPFWDRLLPTREMKQAQYKAALGTPGRYRRIFVGSSTTLMGIDPGIVDRIAEGRSFNAGQFGYAPVNIISDVVEEIIAAKAAGAIVYVMDSWAGGLPIADRQLVDRHSRSDHALWLSSIFRNRDVFFFWVAQLSRGKFVPPSHAWIEHLQTGGRFLAFDGIRPGADGYYEALGSMNPGWSGYLGPSVFGAWQAERLERIFNLCREAGVQLSIVRPPEYARTYEEAQAVHEALSRQIAKLSASHGAAFIDFSRPGSFPHHEQALFFDIHHVNAAGARVFSAKLALALRDRER